MDGWKCIYREEWNGYMGRQKLIHREVNGFVEEWKGCIEEVRIKLWGEGDRNEFGVGNKNGCIYVSCKCFIGRRDGKWIYVIWEWIYEGWKE